jgi:hypothetical protein
MESTFIFLPLPPFLYSSDSLLVPVLPFLRPVATVCSSISDLVHFTQFFITPRAYNLTIGAIATIANPVPLIIYFQLIIWMDILQTQQLSHPSCLRHFRFFHSHTPKHHLLPPRRPFHLSASPVLLSFVSGYLSCVDPSNFNHVPFKVFFDYTAHANFSCHR